MASPITIATVTWLVLNYARPLCVAKATDWTLGWIWPNPPPKNVILLERQQRTLDEMEYRLIYLTRELRKLHSEISRSQQQQPKQPAASPPQDLDGSICLLPYPEQVEEEIRREEEEGRLCNSKHTSSEEQMIEDHDFILVELENETKNSIV